MSNFEDIIGERMNKADKTPLKVCSVCNEEMGPHDYFVIAKAFQDGKVLLEALQCFACQAESQEYASEQSMENIMLYSGRRFSQYLQDPLQRKMYHLEDPSCMITGEALARKDTFELYHFNIPGAQLADDNFFFVGPTAVEQMSELLSEETRKNWEKFIDQLTPDTPELVISPMFF